MIKELKISRENIHTIQRVNHRKYGVIEHEKENAVDESAFVCLEYAEEKNEYIRTLHENIVEGIWNANVELKGGWRALF